MPRKPRNRNGAAPPARPPAHVAPLFTFAVDYFQVLGAEVAANSQAGAETLQVMLPPELAAHFGQPALSLCFHSDGIVHGHELVAHGSRIFDRMMSYLELRSAFAVQQLPARFKEGDALMRSLTPVNASVQDLHIHEQRHFLFVYYWRITYRADDKRQEVFTLVLDQEGRRLPLWGEPGAPADAVDLAQLLADATPVELEQNEEGHLLPPKLPPLTQLVRLGETARRYATYHADLRCVTHEAEILPRLHRTLNRLTSYYQQQIEEVYDAHDPEGEKRRVLMEDLDRKIAEEVENHRLRVQVELVGYVALQQPMAVLEMTLTDGKRSAPARVLQDQYTGVFQRPACYACSAPLTAVALDKNGHLTCDNCIEQCAACQEIVCQRCGVAPCPVCGRSNCADCGVECWACGARACADHIGRCPRCGDLVCHACQSACAVCGELQCRSHLHADCVADAEGSHGLICATCAIRCPGCQQFSAQTGICAASGQTFCRNCLAACTHCGKLLGPGFYVRDVVDQRPYCPTCIGVCPGCGGPAATLTACSVSGVAFCANCLVYCAGCGKALGPTHHRISELDRKPYCEACMKECPACGRITPVRTNCGECGAGGCPRCMAKCAVCQKSFCGQHLHRISGCEHKLCTAHVSHCGVGGEDVCPLCEETCPICERLYCEEHARLCKLCGQEYCRECVRSNGLCDTCAMLPKHGVPVDLRTMDWAQEKSAAKMVGHYRWKRLESSGNVIYLGDGLLGAQAVIVTQRFNGVERVVWVRRIDSMERARGLLGL